MIMATATLRSLVPRLSLYPYRECCRPRQFMSATMDMDTQQQLSSSRKQPRTNTIAEFQSSPPKRIRGSNIKTPMYQTMVYNYLQQKEYWKELDKKFLWSENGLKLSEVRDFLVSTPIISTDISKDELDFLRRLPQFIATMKQLRVPIDIVELCDSFCAEAFSTTLQLQLDEVSSFEFIQAWLTYFNPGFPKLLRLLSFKKLLQYRSREVLSSPQENADFPDKLVHLSFLAGLGKKNFESHEILNKLATVCDENTESTYKRLTPMDMAIFCESLFKGGIRVQSEESLSTISDTLCNFLSQTLEEPEKAFNSFIIISLLKTLRQADFVDEKLLRFLSELIFHPLCNEEHGIRFYTNIVSAFHGPGRKQFYPVPNAKSDLSIEKVLGRIESTTLRTLEKEQSSLKKDAESMEVKSRLKDIAKWLWATACLGYQLRPEIYFQDLSRRLDDGQFSVYPDDAVDALLALAIMNQYPESIVPKILKSADFRSAVKVNCLSHHKGRLGLFLTALRIEKSPLLLNQLSHVEEQKWFDALRTQFSLSEDDAWSTAHRLVRVSRFPGMEKGFKPHTQLLNMTMDALNNLLSALTNESKISSENPKSVPYLQQVPKVMVGCAVPFLYVPGIKVVFPSGNNRNLYVEIIDEIGLALPYQKFKMRLMEKTKCHFVSITRPEIENLDGIELTNFLRPIIASFLENNP